MTDESGQAIRAGLHEPDLRHVEADALGKLASGVDDNDILLDVCERTGWSWPEAVEFLDRLRIEKGKDLAWRRFPLALVISLVSLFIGLGILAACFLALYDVVMAAWRVRGIEDLSELASILLVQVPTLQLSVLGAGMVAGGTIGLVRASSDVASGG